MARNFLKDFPEKQEILDWYSKNGSNQIHEVNGHFHTPYSFSAFNEMKQVFEMAKKENVNILGINDFYTMAGYEEFHDMAFDYRLFPLFNIEFMGLLKEEQKAGIRVNDPDNPGRTYLSGKGLDYPVSLEGTSLKKLEGVRNESTLQTREMVKLASEYLSSLHPELNLDYDEILRDYTRGMVRERHIARVIRAKVFSKFKVEDKIRDFMSVLFNGKPLKASIENHSAVEGEIRGHLLKAGGPSFVKEDPKAFLEIDEVIRVITDAGGIPCYPVLLDDKNGNYTEYENDMEKLFRELTGRNIYSLELIPGRNDLEHLREFVHFFNDRGFVISFGTEHNTPDLIPLKITARGGKEPDEDLKRINFEGACVIAAHQYLRVQGEDGYIERNGKPKTDEKDSFIELGNAVIEYLLYPEHSEN